MSVTNKLTTKEQVASGDDVIILRSVYGKVGQIYYIQPTKDPSTGRFPSFVKPVNAAGDIILTEKELNSGEYFIKETETFKIIDGTTFDLKDEIQRKQWEAIKHCVYIAPERFAKDSNGNYLIDGTIGWKSKNPRYGSAELYIDRPGFESQKRVSRKKLVHNAISFILDDPRGLEGHIMAARLLGKNMTNIHAADVEDYLISIAEKDPKKIISIYTGDDTSLRLLFIEAREKHVIYMKNKLYMYADSIVLGATDDAVITWMKNPKNAKTLELIRQDTYPENYTDEELKNTASNAKSKTK